MEVARKALLTGLGVLLCLGGLSHWGVLAWEVGLGLTAGTCVVVGSLRSKQLSPVVREEEVGCLEWKEAVRLPIVASICLFGCYLLVVSGWKAWVEAVASGYFTLLGICAVKFYLKEAFEPLFSFLPQSSYRTTWKPPFSPKPLLFVCTFPDLFLYFLASLLGFAYYFTKLPQLNNLLAVSFSLYAIETTSLGSFATGTFLLIGLCLYDGLWAVATNVLPTVMREMDLPIKMMFPHMQGDVWTTDYALLGLGDVIMPGLVVAMAYRLDYFMACKKERKGAPKYFIYGLIGYLVGLFGSLLVPWTGLLCILPSLSIWLSLAALSNHDLKSFQTYKED